MPVVTYDGQSLILDGRRVWLVSGSVHYARLARGSWRDRIQAAAQAGLNCIETAVPWALHEPEPGAPRFKGEADLRHFIELIRDAGLYCLLRTGPYIGDGWDMGGLPPWLLRAPPRSTGAGRAETQEPPRLRQASPPFLQAVARYLDSVIGQVRDLQASEAAGAPILAVQNEHLWLCHHPRQAEEYLGQVGRYLRESGCTVPVITRNNLWQEVSGAMETWHGTSDALSTGRQMRIVQPAAPPLVHITTTDSPPTWGSETKSAWAPGDLQRRLGEAAAAGAMFNIDPFCGGTNFGFSAGRLTGGLDRFLTTEYGADAPLGPTGQRTESYQLVKRLATFLSSFPDVIAHLKPDDHHTVAATGLSVVHRSGSQGAVVFLLRDESGPAQAELITPDGRSLGVHLGDERVAWLMLDATLAPGVRLDATNLRPWALIERKLLVLFGPAASQGIISVNGTMLNVTVPTGDRPELLRQDDVTIALLNTRQLDAACIGEAGLYIGIDGFDGAGEPIPHPEFGGVMAIAPDGSVSHRRLDKPRRSPAPKLGAWQSLALEDYARGTAARFATLAGPRSLEECGATRGYGWYSIALQRSRARKVNLLIPHAGDRLHVYTGGKLKNLIGSGLAPGGATPLHKPWPLNLPAGKTDLVFLADNLGRFSEGLGIERPAGLCGHLLDVKPIKPRKPKVTQEPRVDPFILSGYVPYCSVEARGPFPRYTFDLTLPPAPGLVVSLRGERPRCVILINSQPVALDPAEGTDFLQAFDKPLHKGTNRITLALLDRPGEGDKPFDPLRHMAIFGVVENLSADSQWHYARWQLPDRTAMQPSSAKGRHDGPAFFRTTFTVRRADGPLMLQIAGATKGQIYLNGHNVGRYWVATPDGRKVPPQDSYYLPEPWLHTDAENELIFFDEHGRSPARSRLVYE